jgi:hypothetical protein
MGEKGKRPKDSQWGAYGYGINPASLCLCSKCIEAQPARAQLLERSKRKAKEDAEG